MLDHYLASALRRFLRTPFVTAVNVITLALGLLCFVTAYAVIGFWERSDQHFENADRIFAVTSDMALHDGSASYSALPRTNHYVAQYLLSDFPQIEAVARVVRVDSTFLASAGDRAARLSTYAADAAFLDIFDLPVVAGAPRDALRQPGSVVLTQNAAEQLFGSEDPIGLPILVGNTWETTVTAVVGEIPEPSHMGDSLSAPLNFDMLVSRDVYEAGIRNRSGVDTTEMPQDWLRPNNLTYVLLPENDSFSVDELRSQLSNFAARHIPSEQISLADLTLDIVPVGELLEMSVTSLPYVQRTGLSISTSLLLFGALVLAIACLNFANLSTARAVMRAREVGMRKVVGAKRTQLIQQHLIEVALTTFVALVVALSAVSLSMPVLDSVFGIDLRLSLLADLKAWTSLAAVLVVVTVLAGGYSAFVLSRVHPALALRMGTLRLGPRFLSNLLVGVQFALATFLLAATVVTYLQNAEIKRAAMSTAADPLLVIENFSPQTGLDAATFRTELLRLPQISAATVMDPQPWSNGGSLLRVSSSPDSAAPRSALMYWTQEDFFSTLDIDLLAGRGFDTDRGDDFATDENAVQSLVIDLNLSEELGFNSAEEAIDKLVYVHSQSSTGLSEGPPPEQWRVIGVAENTALSISSGIGGRPNAYRTFPYLTYHVVRLSGTDIPAALSAIDELWQRLVPAIPVSRHFVDEYFNESFQNYGRINRAFTGLVIFALVIATIGLFSMAVLITSRRAHEIAVRKILGARVQDIVRLLLADFSKPVLIGVLIACPFAYFAARSYLSLFVSPVDLTALPFVFCVLSVLLIAWSAVGVQTWRAAKDNPADVLRYE